MKTLIAVAVFAVVSLFSGCGTTTGLSPSVSQGGFDNARSVSISPHANAISGMIGTAIGAQWSEAHSDHVILIVAVVNHYTGITGAALNIDGDKIELTPTPTVTDMITTAGVKWSTKGFVTNLDVVERIVKSKRTWIRVETPTGSMEDPIIDGAKDSKAYHALIRFLAAVKG